MNKGFSLFEVVVCMALLMIILPALFQITLISQKIISKTDNELWNIEQDLFFSHVYQRNAEADNYEGLTCELVTLPEAEHKKDCAFTLLGKTYHIYAFKK